MILNVFMANVCLPLIPVVFQEENPRTKKRGKRFPFLFKMNNEILKTPKNKEKLHRKTETMRQKIPLDYNLFEINSGEKNLLQQPKRRWVFRKENN